MPPSTQRCHCAKMLCSVVDTVPHCGQCVQFAQTLYPWTVCRNREQVVHKTYNTMRMLWRRSVNVRGIGCSSVHSLWTLQIFHCVSSVCFGCLKGCGICR